MECKQAPRAEHTRRRPPDAAGCPWHGGEPPECVPALEKQGQVHHQVSGLRAEHPALPLLLSCDPLDWMAKRGSLDSVRAEEFPLGACSQRNPTRSIRRGRVSSPLSLGREPACTVGPGTHLFIRGVLCGFAHGAEDLAAPARGFSRPCFSSLLHLSPQQPGPHTDSRKYNTGVQPGFPQCSACRPAFPRPLTLGFKQPLPRKGRCSGFSPVTQTRSSCLVTGLLDQSTTHPHPPLT